jgi:hypothetical protein
MQDDERMCAAGSGIGNVNVFMIEGPSAPPPVPAAST